MRTRTLLLLALACGLAILVAGVVLLAQLLGSEDTLEPTPLGEPARIGDMRVVVRDADEVDGTLSVDIVIGGVDDPDGLAGFRMIASGRPVLPLTGGDQAGACGATTVEDQSCTLRFDVSSADGESRVLFYDRGDQRARWVLGAA